MWIAIFTAVIAAAVGGLIYLSGRFSKFRFVSGITKGKKLAGFGIGALITAILTVLLILVFEIMNCIVILLHLTVIWALCDLIGFIIRKVSGKKSSAYICGTAALTVTAVYLCFGWYFAHHVVPVYYNLDNAKNSGELRVIQFADSHVGNTFDAEKFGEYIDEINSQKPDVVLITGDFADDYTSRDGMLDSIGHLSRINARYGVFYVFGNHDKGYYNDDSRGWSTADFVSELKNSGVRILEDESVMINDSFCIIGRQDLSEETRGGSRADMKSLTADIGRDVYTIVMDHQPSDYDAQADSGVDLVLSGHTHGGQLIPITYAGEWMGVNCATYGLERRKDTDFIVTSGIGDWAIGFKTGCKAEYVVIDIK